MSYSQLYYHIVFSTRERRKLLQGDLLPRVCDYIGGIVHNLGQILLQANGMADHIHLAVRVKPNVNLSDFVRDIKANSSRWIKSTLEGMEIFSWQDGYAVFSVSYSGREKLIDYVKNQPVHHKEKDFEIEFVQLLNKHGIEYDERYVFQ